MSKTYIFAVGGTGARVMRSLTMVLASGGDNIRSDMEIVPMIYDYDLQNGDKDRTIELMDCYKTLHDLVYSSEAIDVNRTGGLFFSGKMTKIKDQSGKNSSATKQAISVTSGFAVDMDKCVKKPSQDNIQEYYTLSDYINYNQLGGDVNVSQALLNTLYDKESELEMPLNIGFRGRPNVGCVVIDKIETLPEYRHFRVVFNKGDRIVIIGSVFGGTGATCIPSLLRMLREDEKTKDVPIAIIAALPYFNVKDDKNSSIDSRTFPAKTKAAIATYEDMVYKDATAVYFIGDKGGQNAFANHEGNKEQKNEAALCELEGAFDVLHFINLDDTVIAKHGDGHNEALAFENGFNTKGDDMPSPVMYKHFMRDNANENNLMPYIDSLNRFVLFSKFNRIVIKNKPSLCAHENWYKNHLDKDSNSIVKTFKDNLDEFASALFQWVEDLQGETTPRKLKLYAPKLSDEKTKDFLNFMEEPYDKLVIQHRVSYFNEYAKVGCYNVEFKDAKSVIDMLAEEYGENHSTTEIRKHYLRNDSQTVAVDHIPAFYIELSSIVWKQIYSAIKEFKTKVNTGEKEIIK